MTQGLMVAAGERGVIRLFALEMAPEHARFLSDPAAAAQMLGLDQLEPGQAEVIRLEDLDGLGLAGYLTEGCGIPTPTLAADLDRLQAQTGFVLLLRSRAFPRKPVTLSPDPRLRLLGHWQVPATDWTAPGPIETASARPFSAPRPAPRQVRARARLIGGALVVGVLALLALAVWWVLA